MADTQQEERMSLTKQNIIDYALRYIEQEDIVDFPMPGEIFAIFSRKNTSEVELKPDDNWHFNGYNICIKYLLDEDTKSVGKWIWFDFVSLVTYPPQFTSFKLQPPHVAKGIFHDPDRVTQVKIMKMNISAEQLNMLTGTITNEKTAKKNELLSMPDNILKFPTKKTVGK